MSTTIEDALKQMALAIAALSENQKKSNEESKLDAGTVPRVKLP
jgi:hypothetical protein